MLLNHILHVKNFNSVQWTILANNQKSHQYTPLLTSVGDATGVFAVAAMDSETVSSLQLSIYWTLNSSPPSWPPCYCLHYWLQVHSLNCYHGNLQLHHILNLGSLHIFRLFILACICTVMVNRHSFICTTSLYNALYLTDTRYLQWAGLIVNNGRELMILLFALLVS